MLVGFLDGQGRAYDLNFRTLKRRIRDAEGDWDVEPGERLGASVSVEAALFWQTERPHLLMRPTGGVAATSAKRLVFLAGESVPRTDEEPTTFNVSVHVPRTAVDHLFREMGGRELIEVRREDLRGTMESRAELTLRIEAPWIGGPEPATFLLVLRPLAAAREAVAPLGLS